MKFSHSSLSKDLVALVEYCISGMNVDHFCGNNAHARIASCSNDYLRLDAIRIVASKQIIRSIIWGWWDNKNMTGRVKIE